MPDSAMPHPHRSKTIGLQRRLPVLLEVQEAKPPGGSQGGALTHHDSSFQASIGGDIDGR